MDDLTREFLIESQGGLDRMGRCLTELEQRPQDKELLGEIFRSVHTIKGTAGCLAFKRLEKLAHAGEKLLGQLRDGKVTAGATVITTLLHLLDGLRELLKTIKAEDSEGNGDDSALIARLEELQVSTAGRKGRGAQFAHLAPEAEAVMASIAAAVPEPAAAEPADTPSAHAEASKSRAQRTASESTLCVDVALLNRMMNLMGELMLTRNEVLQATAGDPNMTLLSRRLDMVTADLHESVMRARTQTASGVFSGTPRPVRDVTHALGNALDHGVEPPTKREVAGKDAEDTLTLRAARGGNHVVIEVLEDGAGLAFEKIRSQAIERGLLSAERAAQLSERELMQLVFLPGFSTAAGISNVSGGGVDMDVVRTNVKKIGD
jgi:two-component system, chemotaxis family, sensor kinase CheA